MPRATRSPSGWCAAPQAARRWVRPGPRPAAWTWSSPFALPFSQCLRFPCRVALPHSAGRIQRPNADRPDLFRKTASDLLLHQYKISVTFRWGVTGPRVVTASGRRPDNNTGPVVEPNPALIRYRAAQSRRGVTRWADAHTTEPTAGTAPSPAEHSG